MTIENTQILPIHPIISNDVDSIVSENAIDWEKLQSKTVLITGASGLIGSYLVYTLLHLNETKNTNIKLLALVRNREKAEKQFGRLLERDDCQLLVQDVRSPINYADNIHYIIHTASLVGRNDFTTNPVGVITANLTSTENLLEFAKEKSVDGFLYLSSREIYGEPVSGKQFVAETDYGVFDHTLVRSCYPESKRMAENLCVCYRHQYNIPVKIVRLAHVYGPEFSLSSGRVWEEFIEMAINRQDIALNSDGKTELALTYVSDAISGLFFVLLHGDETVYNVGNSSEIISVRGLAELIAGYAGVSVRSVAGDSTGYLKNKVAFLDSRKVEELGWGAKCSLREWIERCLKYFSS